MEVTRKLFKYATLILLLCYAVSATCSRKASVNTQNKAVFTPLRGHTVKTNLSLSYDAKGLQPLFNLANSFMNSVQPKNFGEVFKDYADDLGKLFSEDWQFVLKEYEIPILVTIGIGLLFVLLMPLVGFFFCCCRCCDRCGGDMKQSEKKAQQHCKVAFFVFFLFAFTVLMLCGTLFMFVTNNRMHDAGNKGIDVFDNAVGEVDNLIDVLDTDIRALTTNQVDCILDLVEEKLGPDRITQVIGAPLQTYVRNNVSAIFDVAISMGNDIDGIANTLQQIVTGERSFNTSVETLKSSLDTAKDKLKKYINDCKANATLVATGFCGKLENIDLDVNMDFSSVPNVGKYLSEIEKIKNKGLDRNIRQGNETVNKIPETVIDKSNSSIQGILEKMSSLRQDIEKMGKNATDKIDESAEDVMKNVRTGSDIDWELRTNQEWKSYEAIRWKVYIALSALMAFIVLLLFCGLACGSCGYNKEYMPTERSATANCGGNFLMAAVGIMFIFSFILMIFCVIWFAVGMHLHVICRELKNGEIIDNLAVPNFGEKFETMSFEKILRNCRENMAIYQATSPFIETIFNVSKELDIKVLDDINENIQKDIDFSMTSEQLLTPEAEQALTDTISSDVYSIDFVKFHEVLNKDVMARNLTEVAANLTALADQIKSSNQNMADGIYELARNLTNLLQTTITPLKETTIKDLKVVVTNLETQIAPMKGKATVLLSNLKSSENFLQRDTEPYIKARILDFANPLIGYVKDGVDHIIYQLKNEALKCKPIANIYDGVINTYFCNNVIQNSNGFWLALGWCLLFFIPSIILSVKLAKYFRKMDYSTGMDTIVVDHPPYNDKLPAHTPPYTTPGYSSDIRAPPPYTSTQHNNPGYQHA